MLLRKSSTTAQNLQEYTSNDYKQETLILPIKSIKIMHYPTHIILWFEYKGRIHIKPFCFNPCHLVQTFAFTEQTFIYAQDVASLLFFILLLTPENKELFGNDRSASQDKQPICFEI